MQSIRIIRAATSATFTSKSSGYDFTHAYMHGYHFDLTRKTGVLKRQSRKGADETNPESRLWQDGLTAVALELRGDNCPHMISEYDEGSGVSGQKKIHQRARLLELWTDLLNGTLGSIVVAREDRLFRHKFLTQPSQFAEECARRNVLLIVAGRRCYDFNIHDDYNDFMEKMKESYGYLSNHMRYVYEMKLQKLQRGEWVGGGLCAPYVLDRAAIQFVREQRRKAKEYGYDGLDDEAATKAFRPVIYAPWQPIALDLFEKFRLFNFSRARLGRYIEEKACVFPEPSAADQHAYIFKANMKHIPGLGYTFADSACLSAWLTNLAHIGFASAGKDEQGNRVYIENAFDAAIPRDLFEECYQAVKGHTIYGEPVAIPPNRSRFVRKHAHGQPQALLTRCFTSPDESTKITARRDATGKDYYYCHAKRIVREGEVALSTWDSNVLWTLRVSSFDRAIVDRLTALAEHDKELARRVEDYYATLTKDHAHEKESIEGDIRKLTAAIGRLDQLLTKPAAPLSPAQEARYLTRQQEHEQELQRAEQALKRYETAEPHQFIPAFYRILGEAPGDFWRLDIDRQRRLLRLLIEDIYIENLSPHLFRLRLKWKDPVAPQWDGALLFRHNALRGSLIGDEWTPDEERILRDQYPTAPKLELLKALPLKSGNCIKSHAAAFGLKRTRQSNCIVSRALCYQDWAQACQALGADIDGSEGRVILEQLNYYMQTTDKEGLALWWLLPVMDLSNLEPILSRCIS